MPNLNKKEKKMLEATTKVKNYYLLNIVNHSKKEFHLRVEDTPGTGKHSMEYYSASATRRLDMEKNGIGSGNTPEWILKRYQWMYDNLTEDLEQYVLARTEAKDNVEARAFFKKQRQNIAKSLELLGYKKAC
tara:strand:+ start:192 stop:587 length:396 start_codon:yes stop_codon:yes gene_type:complete